MKYVLNLENFSNQDLSQLKMYIATLISSGKIEAIIQLAESNKEFNNLCRLPIFDEEWISAWSTYSVLVTKDINKSLYDQPRAECKFHLFLGIYYYYQALETANLFKKDCSKREIRYLEQAIQYQSIHACQRLHKYIYKRIDDNKYEYGKESHCKIIRQIQKLLPIYSCYAYLMLAEAYVRYGLFLKRWGHNADRDAAFASALEACHQAQIHFKDNDVSVYNASLGETLAESNSLGLSNMEEISNLIQSLKKGEIEQDFLDNYLEASSLNRFN